MIEAEIAKLEADILEWETALTTPEVYRDADKVKKTMAAIRRRPGEAPGLVRTLGRGGGAERVMKVR